MPNSTSVISPVSVVTVCRNALSDLELTIGSVELQRHAALRYLVVDGASTDGTPAYLARRGAPIDEWVSEKDRGIYDAMNKAIERCPSDSWVLFLNAGDRFAHDEVLERACAAGGDNADIIFGHVAVRSVNGEARVYPAKSGASGKMPGCHQSMLVRAELLKRHRFDTSFRVGADFDFYLRALQAGARVYIFDDVIAEVAPEGFSAANERVLQRDYTRTIARHHGQASALAWLAKRWCRRALLSMRKLISQD